MRVAIGGFQHETNTFSPTPTTWTDFATADTWPGLLEGDAVLAGMRPAPGSAPSNIPMAGFIAAARQTSHTLIPTVWCAAGPSGRVTRDAFERIVGMLTEGIANARSDAVYLDLHGAMAAEHIDDADGEILQRVRALIGVDVPIIASLDLHANVSQKMIDHADVLVAYRTYPHVDMAATGVRAFNWIARRLAGAPRPHAAWLRAPYLIPMCWQCTDDAPARDLYALLDHVDTAGEDSASFTMGFPAADVEKCGPAVWAYGASAQSAQDAAQGLLDAVNAAEGQFDGEIFSAENVVAHAIAIGRDKGDNSVKNGPVVIADAQDNPGAGGSADTTALLKALIAARANNAVLGLLVDPQAVQLAHGAGAGERLRLSLGGKSGIEGDSPLEAEFLVERLHGGDVTATGSVFSGYRLTLGASALLAVGGVRVIVVSKPVQLLDLALLRFIGVEPTEQAIIAVKSTVHFRADFAPIAGKILICAAPGAFPLDPRQLEWTRLPDWMRRMPAAQ